MKITRTDNLVPKLSSSSTTNDGFGGGGGVVVEVGIGKCPQVHALGGPLVEEEPSDRVHEANQAVAP